MANKSIPTVTASLVDFDVLTNGPDEAVFQRFQFACSMGKKRIFPKSVKYDRGQVVRGEKHVTIRFYLGEIETARFSFVPSPSFA